MHPKPSRHITQQLEAYIDHQLTPEERRRVEEHIATCSSCARRLFDAQRISAELGPVLKTSLGQPVPPSALHVRMQEALNKSSQRQRVAFWWAIPGQLLNVGGTIAVVALLALGLFTVLGGRLSDEDRVSPGMALQSSGGGDDVSVTLTQTPTPSLVANATPSISENQISTPIKNLASLSDTLPTPTPVTLSGAQSSSEINKVFEKDLLRFQATPSFVEPSLPGGTIAFSFFNTAPNRQVYETHLINPNGANHQIFPLDGVSEPALSADGQRLAYRAWSQPTSPRSLLSSNLEGLTPARVGGFWEDALPDWSPLEERLIFSSQRESDRRWRLYTSWGDGSGEVNLHREGRNPSFAPDGVRFAFEGCDDFKSHCGLWIGDLAHAQQDAYPFLEEPLAQAPDWSPGGEEVVYMANPGGNWDLYGVDVDGNNVRRLTTNAAVDGLPVWSPDGAWLAFLSNRGGAWGIWLLHVDTSAAQQLINLPNAEFTLTADSPYGERNWWDEQLSWSR